MNCSRCGCSEERACVLVPSDPASELLLADEEVAVQDVILTCQWGSILDGDPICSACVDGVAEACRTMGVRWIHPSLVGTSVFDQLADSAELSHALLTLCRPTLAAAPPQVVSGHRSGRSAAMRRLLEPYEQLVELGLAEQVMVGSTSTSAGGSAFAPLLTKPKRDHSELRAYQPTGYGLRMFDALADVAETWSANGG